MLWNDCIKDKENETVHKTAIKIKINADRQARYEENNKHKIFIMFGL